MAAFTNKDYAGTIPALEKEVLDLNRFFVYREENSQLKTAIYDLNPMVKVSSETISGCGENDAIDCLELGSLTITADMPAKINAKLPKCYETEKPESAMIDMREIATSFVNAKVSRGFYKVRGAAEDAPLGIYDAENIKDKLIQSIKHLSNQGVPISQMTILIREDLSLDLKAFEIQYSDFNIVTADKNNFTILNGLGVKDIAAVPGNILNFEAESEEAIDFMIYVPSRTPMHVFCEHPPRLVKFNDNNIGESTKVDAYAEVGAATATKAIKVFNIRPTVLKQTSKIESKTK
jgi:hypothetical protein